jgi:hypothetical protein
MSVHQVPPLVEIGWQQLVRSQRLQSRGTSLKRRETSQTGRPPESAISLAVILIAAARADAQTLLETHQTSDATAQLAAMHRTVRLRDV